MVVVGFFIFGLSERVRSHSDCWQHRELVEVKRIGIEVSYKILFGLGLKVFYLPRLRPHRFGNMAYSGGTFERSQFSADFGTLKQGPASVLFFKIFATE